MTACQVCMSPQCSPHFGAMSCLACAAFFRRTVALNVHFTCNGQLGCLVHFELRMICRRCRFEKCLSAGMRRQYVQSKRKYKKRGRKRDEMNEDDMDRVEDASSEPRPSSSTSPMLDVPTPCTCSSRSPAIDMLQMFYQEDRKAMDRRRILYADNPLLAVTHASGDIPFSARPLREHTAAAQLEIQRTDYLLVFEYVKVFPGFDTLTAEEKTALYMITSMAFALLDGAYITAKLTSEGENLMIYTNGRMTSVYDKSYAWNNEDPRFADLWLEFIQQMHAQIVRPLQRLHIEPVEFTALKVLCIMKLGYFDMTSNMRALFSEYCTRIFADLDRYYQDREDKAVRIGAIVLMMTNALEVLLPMIEVSKRVELFDLCELDTMSKILLRR